MTKLMLRIEAPHFVAAAIARDQKIVRAAPIIAYMIGWTLDRADQYAKSKGWKTALHRTGIEDTHT